MTLTVISSFRLSASFRSCSISPMAVVVRHGHPQIQTGSELSRAKRMLGKTPKCEYTFNCFINHDSAIYFTACGKGLLLLLSL